MVAHAARSGRRLHPRRGGGGRPHEAQSTGESCSEVTLKLIELRTSDLNKVRDYPLRSVASHGNGRAFEDQSRDNEIGVALRIDLRLEAKLSRAGVAAIASKRAGCGRIAIVPLTYH